MARRVREQLLALGIKADREHIFGMGGLLPVEGSAEYRVDAVLLPQGL